MDDQVMIADCLPIRIGAAVVSRPRQEKEPPAARPHLSRGFTAWTSAFAPRSRLRRRSSRGAADAFPDLRRRREFVAPNGDSGVGRIWKIIAACSREDELRGRVWGGGSGAGPSGGGGRTELDELSAESKKVGGAIFQMQTQVSSFKRMVDALGTSKDTRELRARSSTSSASSSGGWRRRRAWQVKRMAQTVHDAESSDARGAPSTSRSTRSCVKDFPRRPEGSFRRRSARAPSASPRFCCRRRRPARATARATTRCARRPAAAPAAGSGKSGGEAGASHGLSPELVRNEGEMEFNNALIERRGSRAS